MEHLDVEKGLVGAKIALTGDCRSLAGFGMAESISQILAKRTGPIGNLA